MEDLKDTQKGIRINANFGQVVATLFLLLVMLVVPIGGYEYMIYQEEKGRTDVYTLDAVKDSDGAMKVDIDRVAGISTSDVEKKDNSLLIIGDIPFTGSIFIGIGIVILTFTLFVTLAMLYDFRKQ